MRGLRRVALTIGSEWLPDPYGPGYTITILGACGMSLGVKLSNAEKKLIRKYYKNCGLMRDAVPQFEEALDGYVNGTPWEFDSPGQKEIVEFRETRKEDLCFPGVMVNVWYVSKHDRHTALSSDVLSGVQTTAVRKKNSRLGV